MDHVNPVLVLTIDSDVTNYEKIELFTNVSKKTGYFMILHT